MPVLIAIFAVGAYAYGSALRGSDIIVNEVAIVRGAPDATEGTAQVYLGVFSPTRGSYQVSLPGGALLSAPMTGDVFGGQGAASTSSRATPRRSATWRSGSARCGRSGPRRRPSCRRSTPSWTSSTASSAGTIRNDSDGDPREAGGRPRRQRRRPQGPRARRDRQGDSPGHLQPAGDGAVRQDRRPDLLRRRGREHRDASAATRPATGSSTSSRTTRCSGTSGLAVGRARSSSRGAATRSSTSRSTGQRPARAANVLYYIPVGMQVRGATNSAAT